MDEFGVWSQQRASKEYNFIESGSGIYKLGNIEEL